MKKRIAFADVTAKPTSGNGSCLSACQIQIVPPDIPQATVNIHNALVG